MLHSHLWFQLEAFLARSSSEVLVELLTGDGCPESSPGLGLFQQFQHTHAFINALVVGAHAVSMYHSNIMQLNLMFNVVFFNPYINLLNKE